MDEQVCVEIRFRSLILDLLSLRDLLAIQVELLNRKLDIEFWSLGGNPRLVLCI